MKKATFCLSLDTELLWGRWDINYQDFETRAAKVRDIVKRLLTIFDKYNIHATWAIVGSLYLQPSPKNRESKLWRAPDIIQEIKRHKNQEIACHSFSHREFTQLTREKAESDILHCLALAKKEQIKLASFVFPRNKVNHLNLLKKAGFTCYRTSNKYQSPFLQLIDLLFPLPNTAKPTPNQGLVAIPGSFYFLSCRGPRKYLPLYYRVRRAKLGINHAIKNGTLFHLWFHPIDLADNTENMLHGIEEICLYASQKEKEGKIQTQTMSQIASRTSPTR